MNLWPRARCTVAGIASLFCRSVFCLLLLVSFIWEKINKGAYCLHH